MTAARLDAAKRAFGEAAVEYEIALDSRQAVPQGDEAARQEWFDRVARASSAYAKAQLELHLARRAAAPSWETLLRDPTQQFDPAGEVMRSIAEYQNATSGTMSAPTGEQDHIG